MSFYSLHLHIKSTCNLLQHTKTCSLLFLNSFDRNNVIIYKQNLKLLQAFILFAGFKLCSSLIASICFIHRFNMRKRK